MKRTKNIAYIILLCVLYGRTIHGQIIRAPLGDRYTGIGTYSNHLNDAFSFSNNQAALATLTTPTAGVYTERRFMLAELSYYNAVVNMPSKMGGFGIAMKYFGDENFNESQVGIAYGRKLGEQVLLGAQVNYNLFSIAGYGKTGVVNFELGTLWQVTKDFRVGAHLYNPVGGKFGKYGEEKLAAIYKVGIGYDVAKNFFISAEVAKEEDMPTDITIAFQYNVHKQIPIRAGITTATNSFFGGIGLQESWFRIDAGATYHPQLGFTPMLLVLFNLKKSDTQ